MSKTTKFPGGELRYDPDGELDEIVAEGCHVHVEVMSDTEIWMGIDMPDGTHVRAWFTSKNGRAHIKYGAEIERR